MARLLWLTQRLASLFYISTSYSHIAHTNTYLGTLNSKTTNIESKQLKSGFNRFDINAGNY